MQITFSGHSRALLALVIAWMLAGVVALGCASSSGAKLGETTPSEPVVTPDWVRTGGNSPRYSRDLYLTGFAMGIADASETILDVRVQAAADLSRKISVRIRSKLLDTVEEREGIYRQELRSTISATTDIQLAGIEYEEYRLGRRSYALGLLERSAAISHRIILRDIAFAAMRECLAGARGKGTVVSGSDALALYGRCRARIAGAAEHLVVLSALDLAAPADEERVRELERASQQVDEAVSQILGGPAGSLAEAAERLAFQLFEQRAIIGASTVAPFRYGTSDLSSAFGRQAGLELEHVLARGSRGQRSQDRRVVLGTFFERGDTLRMLATVSDVETGRIVGSAAATLATSSLPPGLEITPKNVEAALRDERILRAGNAGSGDLQVELWTNRGRRGVVFSEGEELTFSYRVNQPSWVRVIYLLQNGDKVVVEDAIRVGEAQVNRVIDYPDAFEIVPPFGVEHLHLSAFSSKPPRLSVVERVIDGQPYQIIRDGIDGIVRTRGMARKLAQRIAESYVTVTTLPRR